MAKRLLYRVMVLLGVLYWQVGAAWAQCAMCRAPLENNVSNGETMGFAKNLNMGILYLFVMPYLMFGIIAYLWYKKSKANVRRKEQAASNRARALSALSRGEDV